MHNILRHKVQPRYVLPEPILSDGMWLVNISRCKIAMEKWDRRTASVSHGRTHMTRICRHSTYSISISRRSRYTKKNTNPHNCDDGFLPGRFTRLQGYISWQENKCSAVGITNLTFKQDLFEQFHFVWNYHPGENAWMKGIRESYTARVAFVPGGFWIGIGRKIATLRGKIKSISWMIWRIRRIPIGCPWVRGRACLFVGMRLFFRAVGLFKIGLISSFRQNENENQNESRRSQLG